MWIWDWNTQDDRLLYYEGTVWYRTVFTIDGDADRCSDQDSDDASGVNGGTRTFLNFGAANHSTRVFLDGQELCTHVGGFGQFAAEVTGLVGPGSHSLVVQVNNRRTPERVPAMRSDWWNFGGITRSVDLVTVPRTILRDAWLTMAPDGRLVGGATVDGPAAGDEAPSVTVELVDLGVSVDAIPSSSESDDGADETGAHTYAVEFEADVERWAPGRPVLHRVRWTCGAAAGGDQDSIEDEIGFRTIRTEGNRILVNDEPTFFKGIAIHGEGPSGGRRAHGPEDAATLLGGPRIWGPTSSASVTISTTSTRPKRPTVEDCWRGVNCRSIGASPTTTSRYWTTPWPRPRSWLFETAAGPRLRCGRWPMRLSPVTAGSSS